MEPFDSNTKGILIPKAELSALRNLERRARMVARSRTAAAKIKGFRMLENALREIDKARGE